MSAARRFVCAVFAWALHSAAALAQAPPAPGVPALRVTAPNGASNLLIGSLHIAIDGLFQPADAVLGGSRRYVVESRPDPAFRSFLFEPAQEVMRLQSPRAYWSGTLTHEQLALLRERVACNIVAEEAEETDQIVTELLLLKSAALASEFAARHCAPQGLQSRDALLRRAAAARGMAPDILETQAEVDQKRAAVPERIYQGALIRAFTPASPRKLAQVVSALNTGDYEAVPKALRDQAVNPADADLYWQIMATERNRAWLPQLMRYLDEGGAFVNVGVAHLPGPDGLIALLQGKGYSVEPILLPARD